MTIIIQGCASRIPTGVRNVRLLAAAGDLKRRQGDDDEGNPIKAGAPSVVIQPQEGGARESLQEEPLKRLTEMAKNIPEDTTRCKFCGDKRHMFPPKNKPD